MPDQATLIAAAGGAAALALAGVAARAAFAPRSSLFCPVLSRGPTTRPLVALTFDDGPWPGSTPAELDALAGARARATFFVIGSLARQHPDLIRRIAAQGHQIGNHTYDHHRLGLFRHTRYWRSQIDRTGELLLSITGAQPVLFRPPMGFKSPWLASAARAAGSTIVTWSLSGRDGVATTAQRIVHRVSRAGPGDIVLLHDGRDPASRRDVQPTVDALPRVLEAIAGRGLAMVRVDELLAP